MDKDKEDKLKKIRAKKQKYPSYQYILEKYQLLLNQGAVKGDMKQVGKYNTLINEIWEKYHQPKK